MFLKVLYNNKFNLPSLPPPSIFTDKTVLITGGTSGLGLASAVHFINLGAKSVIITGRTASKCLAAKTEIELQTKTAGNGILRTMELDMSIFAGVKKFVDEVKKEAGSLDYVVLNAGMMSTSFRLGKEGITEESIEVNTLSTALLAILLLPWLKEVGKGRAHMVVVTSGLHRGVSITPSKFPQTNILGHFSKDQKNSGQMYAINKLLIQYCIREISKLAIGPDGTPQVTITPMCPGMVKSELGREYRTNVLLSTGMDAFMNLAMKTTEGGARSVVRAALEKENGAYFTDYQSVEDYEKAVEHNVLGPEGRKMQAQVWKEVIEVLRARVPEVKDIVGDGAQKAML